MATPYILAPHCFCCSIALGRSGRLRHLRPGWFSRWLRLLRSEPECGCSCSAGSGFRLTRFYRVHLTLLQTHTKNTTRLTIFLFKKKTKKNDFGAMIGRAADIIHSGGHLLCSATFPLWKLTIFLTLLYFLNECGPE